jgi:hypothetical protein
VALRPVVATVASRPVSECRAGRTENGVAFESKVFVGRVLCNDVMLPPPSRPDVIRTCVPLPNGAMAGYVPDPRIHARDAPAERR